MLLLVLNETKESKRRIEMTTKNRYTKTKLNKFKNIILNEMDAVTKDMGDIKEGIIETGESNTSYTPDSIYSVHMADAGTDSHEREKSFQLMARENSYYKKLEEALDRIADGSFGICLDCTEEPKNLCVTCPLIPEERLIEVPIATRCVECKEKGKLGML
ncbi:MAG: TraR/DksA family transcriptional regulator [Candidatus Neomarinimicrobiota bacterium]|jgi:RNA polymerase-binding transcription factor DksA